MTELSEFDHAMFKKLKTDSDALELVRGRLRCQKKVAETAMANWKFALDMEASWELEAYEAWRKADADLNKLYIEEQETLKRVKRHVTSRT